MASSERIRVARVDEVPPGQMRGASVGDERIVVANVDGMLYAMRAICNHMGAFLDEGQLRGKEVQCPWHGSRWDATTGQLLWFPRPLPPEPIYRVAVENGEIYVER